MSMRTALVFILLAGAVSAQLATAGPVRVACIGNSITAGAMLPDSRRESYPAVLARLLGAEYEVGDFGVSGATLLRNGDIPYWNDPAFREATEFEPQIAVIELGTNDSKAENWEIHARTFAADAAALVAHFARLPSQPAIWLCLPLPAYSEVGGIREAVLREIRRELRRVAADQGVRIIDAHATLDGKPHLLADGVHPNAAGAELLAQTVASALTNSPDQTPGR